ncbi:hypothetical protein TNIN_124111 [Trichonephila inaurata madagascariensis]|uniref:Uncharacterized protein n=1 Tax=Trichonephila inaurata madagascariensis TaxID=2747483 RepID=A0A8X6YWM4_9ARAC|nr:hypothetical protein TNIN_124111 [Trichonephila inaurata madagascariensis]
MDVQTGNQPAPPAICSGKRRHWVLENGLGNGLRAMPTGGCMRHLPQLQQCRVVESSRAKLVAPEDPEEDNDTDCVCIVNNHGLTRTFYHDVEGNLRHSETKYDVIEERRRHGRDDGLRKKKGKDAIGMD